MTYRCKTIATYLAGLAVLEVCFHLPTVGRVTLGGSAAGCVLDEGNVKLNVPLPFFPLFFGQATCCA